MLLTKEGKIQEGKTPTQHHNVQNGLTQKKAQQTRVPTEEWMMDNSPRR